MSTAGNFYRELEAVRLELERVRGIGLDANFHADRLEARLSLLETVHSQRVAEFDRRLQNLGARLDVEAERARRSVWRKVIDWAAGLEWGYRGGSKLW